MEQAEIYFRVQNIFTYIGIVAALIALLIILVLCFITWLSNRRK